jgi:hypothetical protein
VRLIITTHYSWGVVAGAALALLLLSDKLTKAHHDVVVNGVHMMDGTLQKKKANNWPQKSLTTFFFCRNNQNFLAHRFASRH